MKSETTGPELTGKQKENSENFAKAFEHVKDWRFEETAKDDAIICLHLVFTETGNEQRNALKGIISGEEEAIGALLVQAGMQDDKVGNVILAAAELIKEQRAHQGPPVDAVLEAVKKMFPGAEVKLISATPFPRSQDNLCQCPMCVEARQQIKKPKIVN